MKRLAIRTVVVAALSLAGFVPAAGAVVVRLPGGRFAGVFPKAGVNPASLPGRSAAGAAAKPFAADNGTLQYNGGSVLHSSSPYLIFWTPSGESIPGQGEALMSRYLSDVALASGTSSNVYGVLRQYTDSDGFANYSQSFSGPHAIVDTQPYPGLDAVNCVIGLTDPKCLTDDQLQSEISRLISTLHLPSGTGAGAPIYFVVTPPDVNVCMDFTSCASSPMTGFCAYHSDFNLGGTGPPVVYASLPYFVTQDPKSCQADNTAATQEPNGDVADIMIDNMSHENSESITDPLESGWFDVSSGSESADNCESYGPTPDPANGANPNAYSPTLGGSAAAGTLFDQLINGHPYYTQSEWSNGDVGCVLRPSPGAITPHISVSPPGHNPVGASVVIDPRSSASANPIVGAAWSFGDGSSTLINGLRQTAYAYRAAGRYTVRVVLIDDRGNVATGSQQILVGSPPRASFRSSPKHRPRKHARIRFRYTGKHDPDAGVRIVSYRWSFGDGKHSRSRNPTHRFAKAGTYTVTLTVTNSLGLTHTVRHKVKIRR